MQQLQSHLYPYSASIKQGKARTWDSPFGYDILRNTRHSNILETQTERIEQDREKLESLNAYIDTRAVRLTSRIRRMLFLPGNQNKSQELYLYYRTQCKVINKVLDELSSLEKSSLVEIFDDKQAIQDVISIYQHLKNDAEQHIKEELRTNQALLDDMNEQALVALLCTFRKDTLQDLHDNEIITSKLYVLLNKELID